MAILKYKDSSGNYHGINSYKISPVIVAQEKGDSETSVMSQKAVSDEVQNLETAVASKANASEVYNKTEVDDKVSTINTAVGKKADSANVYDKTYIDGVVSQVDTKLNSKVPIDSFNEWSETVATKEEVNAKVDEINQAIEDLESVSVWDAGEY